MHKFLRSIGFGKFQKKRDIEALLKKLEKIAVRQCLTIDADTTLCELRAEVAPGMGIVMAGEMGEQGTFRREYYYPYLSGTDISSEADCNIQRHAEKETYAVFFATPKYLKMQNAFPKVAAGNSSFLQKPPA